MPLECFADDGIIVVQQSGEVSIGAIANSLSNLLCHAPSLKPPFQILWDGRLAAASKSSQLIRTVAIDIKNDYPLFASACIALVVNNDLQFGLARLSQTYLEMEGLTVRVFRDLEPASLWLEENQTEPARSK